MKRTGIILAVIVGLAWVVHATLYRACRDFPGGVNEDAQQARPSEKGAVITPLSDTCIYYLALPRDTVIERNSACTSHWLQFAAHGEDNEYVLTRDTMKRTVAFWMHDESEREWLDISSLPAGDYHVELHATDRSGSFTLRIK